MTSSLQLHDVVVEAPDGPAALALEHRLAHLRPVAVSRDHAWLVSIDGVESPTEVASAVRAWLAEIGSTSTLMRVDERITRIEAEPPASAAAPLTQTSTAERPFSPGLETHGLCRPAQPDARVDRDAARRTGQHRVQVELGDLGLVVGEPAEPVQDVGDRRAVGRRRTAPARDEAPRLAAGDQLVGIDVRQRREREPRRADQLGQNTPGAVGDEGAEDRVLDRADEQFDAARDVPLDEHRPADLGASTRNAFRVAQVDMDTPDSVLCTPATAVLTTTGYPIAAAASSASTGVAA